MILAFQLSDLITVPFGWLLGILYHTTKNYGVAMLALGFSSIFFNFVSKSILHATVANVTSTFIMGAVTAVIPILLMLYISHYLKTRK